MLHFNLENMDRLPYLHISLSVEDPKFEGYIKSAPISINSTHFMKNFLIWMCTRSTQPDNYGQGHGVLMPWENGFREAYLLKDHCKIALTGQCYFMS